MKFAKSYEPGNYEADIYAAWEAAGIFSPSIPTYPVDADGDGVDDRAEAKKASRNIHSRPLRDNGNAPSEASPMTMGRGERVANESFLMPNESTYSIVMPPPNANGNLHIGHGLTVATEDSLIRYHRLKGDSSWYIPGADHAGFETWVVYERTLEQSGHTRFEYDRDELYSRVWNFVSEQRGNMELQLRALGASCSWKDLTFTLDENVIDRVYTTFEKMWNDGLIYRGEKLVNFCPKHRTAFADIEVEHQDEKGTLWDIEYRLSGSELAANEHFANPSESRGDESSRVPDSTGRRPDSATRLSPGVQQTVHEREFGPADSIVVSTTRPETLFGDTAIAVNSNDERYKDLIGKKVRIPLSGREIPIIADEHADPEYGSGAVKITPAHDFDDFEVGERHDLPRIQVIAEDGTMINVPEAYAGLTTEKCRKQVLKDLKEQGYLKGEKKIQHSVAHCYKCGTVLEPMLKSQWFVDVEKLAKVAIDHLENNEIKFYPANKQKVLIDYLKNLKDWNISRQIPWGIAIPMFHKVTEDATDEPDWIFDRRTNLKQIEKAGVTYVRDEDTFDTWFSSSHWPIVCTDWTPENYNPYYPLNVMETGADILFAWVARMIMVGLYVTGEVPFKEVYLHGLVLDAHGKKMSKSKGNVINPMDLVAKYGSDAFRIGILRGRSAGMNQAFSENSVISGRNLMNKLWNISRFIQGMVDGEGESGENISKHSIDTDSQNHNGHGRVSGTEIPGRDRLSRCDFDDRESSELRNISPDSISYSTLNMGEDWICRELNDCKHQIEADMANYRFAEAVETLYQTIWDKYADWFLESQKIYQNTNLLKTTLEMILIMLHPFAPFATEAIWQTLSWTEGFIATANWPADLVYDPISAENFISLITIVSEVRGTLQTLPGTNNAKKYGLYYDKDSLVEDNALLIQTLSHVPFISSLDGTPQGLRLALANHELYLDVPEKVVKAYHDSLEEKILSVGRELDALNARMMNPNYVDKAPAALVRETRDQIEEKEKLISRLKAQFALI
ncbi:valine--tRNA ligase [Candidatus Saccharibacteria bacterium]|nr:valine--tRNA ligase [Candidatus Saccharibacteria bacterium]